MEQYAYVPQDPHETPFGFDYDLVLNGTPAEVFGFVCAENPLTEALWFPEFARITWLSPPPYGVHSRREFHTNQSSFIEHFTVWERGARLAFYMAEGSLPFLAALAEDYQLAPCAEGTHLRWRIGYTPADHAYDVQPMLHPVFASQFDEAAANLVRCFAEGRAQAHLRSVA